MKTVILIGVTIYYLNYTRIGKYNLNILTYTNISEFGCEIFTLRQKPIRA